MTDPSLHDLAKSVGDSQTAINIMWTLVAGFLVMFMQAGFAMVETGLVRAKNVAHTMGMNFMVYGSGPRVLGGGLRAPDGRRRRAVRRTPRTSCRTRPRVTIGGHTFGLFGTKGFFLTGATFTSGVAAMFLFQMVFMDTTATIPTGAMAERWKFSGFVLFSFFIATLIYPIFANWTWGGGWLSSLGAELGLGHGHVDFAGSSVVHMTGGVIALVGAKLIGPRIGKYDEHGNAKPIPGHNMSMVVIGTFILAFGWFGFNAGSTLAGTDGQIAIIAVNTMLASASGAFLAYALVEDALRQARRVAAVQRHAGRPGRDHRAVRLRHAPIAVLIGASPASWSSSRRCSSSRRLEIDDPVGAIAVHGVYGAFGVLCVGLFANGTYGDGLNGVDGAVTGLFYGGGGASWSPSHRRCGQLRCGSAATTFAVVQAGRQDCRHAGQRRGRDRGSRHPGDGRPGLRRRAGNADAARHDRRRSRRAGPGHDRGRRAGVADRRRAGGPATGDSGPRAAVPRGAFASGPAAMRAMGRAARGPTAI